VHVFGRLVCGDFCCYYYYAAVVLRGKLLADTLEILAVQALRKSMPPAVRTEAWAELRRYASVIGSSGVARLLDGTLLVHTFKVVFC
jgi:hypothetical protein